MLESFGDAEECMARWSIFFDDWGGFAKGVCKLRTSGMELISTAVLLLFHMKRWGSEKGPGSVTAVA